MGLNLILFNVYLCNNRNLAMPMSTRLVMAHFRSFSMEVMHEASLWLEVALPRNHL